ncbi:MAG: hypothetical protein OER56_17850, partial [Hyphomicrobiales bacterium]|nr:hypothetical protein [Hyphomicrobiales bacterium]
MANAATSLTYPLSPDNGIGIWDTTRSQHDPTWRIAIAQSGIRRWLSDCFAGYKITQIDCIGSGGMIAFSRVCFWILMMLAVIYAGQLIHALAIAAMTEP